MQQCGNYSSCFPVASTEGQTGACAGGRAMMASNFPEFHQCLGPAAEGI